MSQPAQQIRFCTSRDGTRIAYATCGAGPPLVWVQHWVHHLKFDWDSPIWQPWLELLMRRHTLIRYDWRGCGLSDREHVEFSFERYVEDLEAVIEAAGVERFVLFGMAGAGCGAAMNHAVGHPEQVSHLILYASRTRGELAPGALPEQVRVSEARLNMYELGWAHDSPAYRQFFTAVHIPDATTEQVDAYSELLRVATSPANAVGLIRTFQKMDHREIVPQVLQPTLVVHARRDSVISFDEGRLVASNIPGARFAPLDSRNHIILETEPAWGQFVEALDDFLPAEPHAADAVPLVPGGITAREHQILELVAQGHDNATIGTRLGISEKTVRNHVSTIFSKLGVSSRAQAVARARDAGFGRTRLPNDTGFISK